VTRLVQSEARIAKRFNQSPKLDLELVLCGVWACVGFDIFACVGFDLSCVRFDLRLFSLFVFIQKL